ncbi:MAG: hypothetical protein WAV09_01650 [Minisyncoccia bacterium]
MSEKTVKLSELIKPTERQREFFSAMDSHKFTLYGGAKGGGKSYIIRWAMVRLLLKWAKQGYLGVRVAIFCEDYPTLKDRQVTKINTEFPKWLGTLSDSQTEGLSFRLKKEYGGGVIALRNLDDPSKYASSEFAAVAIDEITKNLRDKFDQLRSIIRWPGIEDTKFIAGTNPGDIGHLWVKKLWVDRDFAQDDPRPDQVAFVKSLPTDNPHNAKSYLEELSKLPEKLRKAYWEGNWDVFEGQYFTEWDKERHTIAPFAIPPSFKKYRAYDHGRTNPACVQWFAVDYDGRVWVYRELYVKGLNVDQLALEINRLSGTEQYEYSVADPAIFSNTGMVDKFGGQTIAETFARYGIMFMPASNRRVDGWNLMHQYLAWTPEKMPRLVYFNTCKDSIRTIPSLVHDEIKPEDLDTDGEDHAADTTRYGLMSLHETRAEKPKTEIERKIDAAKRQGTFTPQNFNNIYMPS